MTETLPPRNRRAADTPRHHGASGALGIVLRAIALAALALGLGVAASLLVDALHPAQPGAAAARR
jgi:hypothetical protein